MMDAGFWLGVATPFAVLILFGITRLLLRAISALMRLLNRKVHDRFMRRYVFHEEIDAATAGVWDCCDALTCEGSRECECCGHRSIRTSSLEDVTGIMEELIHLLESEE